MGGGKRRNKNFSMQEKRKSFGKSCNGGVGKRKKIQSREKEIGSRKRERKRKKEGEGEVRTKHFCNKEYLLYFLLAAGRHS